MIYSKITRINTIFISIHIICSLISIAFQHNIFVICRLGHASIQGHNHHFYIGCKFYFALFLLINMLYGFYISFSQENFRGEKVSSGGCKKCWKIGSAIFSREDYHGWSFYKGDLLWTAMLTPPRLAYFSICPLH